MIYESKVLEVCDNGDAIIELNEQLLTDVGWSTGDVLDISKNDDGEIVIKKIGREMLHNSVTTFLEACGQTPSKENAELYSKLISEEYAEFMEAFWNNDDVEQLDACMDMIWVILGYCKMKGFNVDGAWSEVANSNLAKIDQKSGKVLKREDGKVLKPEGWQPPNFGKHVNKS
jgi:predicted HAD superfamily Cof-like phosphohydrolase